MWYNTADFSVTARATRLSLPKVWVVSLGYDFSFRLYWQSGRLGFNASLIYENPTFDDNDTIDVHHFEGLDDIVPEMCEFHKKI